MGAELVTCRQLLGESGAARATIVVGDRVFLGSNEGTSGASWAYN